MAKWVYMFTEGNADMRNLLGGKGANLAEMTNLGLPVPQGFTVTTEACTQYYEDGRQINDDIMMVNHPDVDICLVYQHLSKLQTHSYIYPLINDLIVAEYRSFQNANF